MTKYLDDKITKIKDLAEKRIKLNYNLSNKKNQNKAQRVKGKYRKQSKDRMKRPQIHVSEFQ